MEDTKKKSNSNNLLQFQVRNPFKNECTQKNQKLRIRPSILNKKSLSKWIEKKTSQKNEIAFNFRYEIPLKFLRTK